jgi:protein-disulfide isomerase
MSTSRSSALLALALVAPLIAASCSRGGSSSSASATKPAVAASPTVSGVGVVAEVNGAPILLSELDQKAATRLLRLRQEEYEIRRQALDELVAEKLVEAEAKKRGLSAEELLKREVAAKTEAPSPATILSLYEQNKARFGTTPKDQALARIRDVVGQRAEAERRAAFEKELRDQARVAVRLDPPRASVSVPDGAPATGPATVPVSIVEFTDYQCPYCHRAQSVIDELLARYKGKVRLVHMDFPLEGHPGALPAARAARCAGEQGKFWEFHRDLMTAQGTLDDADLKSRAGKLGLKAADFGTCLASGRHDATIKASFEQGEALGVTGTPAYFVNGRMLSGARPIEAFSQVIDAELAGR